MPDPQCQSLKHPWKRTFFAGLAGSVGFGAAAMVLLALVLKALPGGAGGNEVDWRHRRIILEGLVSAIGILAGGVGAAWMVARQTGFGVRQGSVFAASGLPAWGLLAVSWFHFLVAFAERPATSLLWAFELVLRGALLLGGLALLLAIVSPATTLVAARAFQCSLAGGSVPRAVLASLALQTGAALPLAGLLYSCAPHPNKGAEQPLAKRDASFLIPGERRLLQGVVTANIQKGVEVDGPAFLRLIAYASPEGMREVRVVYHPGEAPCRNQEAAEAGFAFKAGAKAVVYGEATGPEELSTCATEGFFIRSLDPSHVACGCGCCPGVEPEVRCLYRAKGETLEQARERDRQAAQSAACATMGCSRPVLHLYCDKP